jgi:hypothetical protein
VVVKILYQEAIVAVNTVAGGEPHGLLGVVRSWPERTMEIAKHLVREIHPERSRKI